jgi:hypothetical protein
VQLEQLRSSSGDRGENHGEVLLLSSNYRISVRCIVKKFI